MNERHDPKVTTDHETIKKWAEERSGRPAVVHTTHGEEGSGLLRIYFDTSEDENLQEITWREFFEIFENNHLAFLYQEKTEESGESRFFKLVDRTGAPSEE